MSESFGRRFLGASTTEARLDLERAAERRAPFAEADSLLETLIGAALRGDQIGRFAGGRLELLVDVSGDAHQAMALHFEVAEQEKRGSWYVPESEALSLGLIQAAHWGRFEPRLLVSLAEAEKASPQFRGEPEAVAVWVLEPLFEELFLPLRVRGTKMLGVKDAEHQEKLWQKSDPLFTALGLAPESLEPFRPRRGWSEHSQAEILALREALIEAWEAIAERAAERYRIYRIAQLVERYYKKAKKGPPLRRSVLTKPEGRTLSAYFGGDWLAFLAYLGESPNPNEEIVQSLPETKLVAGGSERAAGLAAEHGLTETQVKGMLAAYFQTEDGSSPVELRVATLKHYWEAFDRLHAELRTGDHGLWGLVQEHDFVTALSEDEDGGEYQPRAWERLLPGELNEEIERHWGTALLARWPEKIVTEPAPHARLAECLGPAVRFWNGAALTAWFLCVGPYSRTSLEGLAEYHDRELAQLAELEAPVDPALFKDLIAAEERYGVPEHGGGLSITITIGFAERGGGDEKHVDFETLREIITAHRRAWSERYLDDYLRRRWESELREAGEAYHRSAAERGREPTLKQFAKLAVEPANHWLGGDIAALYGTLGLKAPAAPSRAARLVPADPDSFAAKLYREMRGRASELPPSWKEDPEERRRWNDFQSLAGQCVKYLQIQEASGEQPTLAQFGRQQFTYRSAVLSDDLDEAWERYSQAIARVLGSPPVA